MNVLEDLEGLVSSKWGIVTSLVALIKLEAKLAGLSIVPLVVNLFMLFIILITVWLSAMLMLGYGVLYIYPSKIIAMSLVLLVNIVFLALLLKYLAYNLKKMSFEKTRQYFSNNREWDDHEQKTGDQGDSRDGTNVAVSSETSQRT